MRRIVSGRPRNTAAGMRARSAEVQSINRRAILRPSRHRTIKEKLLKIKIAVKDISFG
jgi:hypothetical protein